jgi:hypothetical protein
LIFPSMFLAMSVSLLFVNKLKYNSILFSIFVICSYIFYKIQHSIFVKYSVAWNMFYS